jgi:hypothetical protein
MKYTKWHKNRKGKETRKKSAKTQPQQKNPKNQAKTSPKTTFIYFMIVFLSRSLFKRLSIVFLLYFQQALLYVQAASNLCSQEKVQVFWVSPCCLGILTESMIKTNKQCCNSKHQSSNAPSLKVGQTSNKQCPRTAT